MCCIVLSLLSLALIEDFGPQELLHFAKPAYAIALPICCFFLGASLAYCFYLPGALWCAKLKCSQHGTVILGIFITT